MQGELLEVTEDMETRLECVSPGGKPAADVSLYKNIKTSGFKLLSGSESKALT